METATMEHTVRDRVAEHTRPTDNSKLIRAIEKSLTYYAERPEDIDSRLEELKHEWDIERTLEANASILALFGLLMGTVGRKSLLLLLPLAVMGFLLQHAIQGWCPPILLFRRLGIRTKEEILLEYTGLRALRGEFEPICNVNQLAMQDRVRQVLATLNK